MNSPKNQDIRNRLLVARMPSLPQTLLKLMALCRSEDAGLPEIAQVISIEPAMAARVMAVAHSAAYHQGDQHHDLMQATSLLGTELIKVLAISESVFQTFNGFTNASSVDLRSVWKHCLTTALIAKDLARRLGNVPQDDAYLAGLLHDVGRLALLAAAPAVYRPIFLLDDTPNLCDIEQERLKISHPEAGAWLARQWNLSSAMVECLLYHHADNTRLAGTLPLTRLVHLAQRLTDLPAAAEAVPDDFSCEFELTLDDLLAVVKHAQTKLQETARDLGVDISDTPSTPTAQQVTDATPPQLTIDKAQADLAQEMRNRALLADLPHTLTQHSGRALLSALRQQAGLLLQLDDSVVMLLRQDLHTLVLASDTDRHPQAAQLSTELSAHPLVASCVTQIKVVFSAGNITANTALLTALNTQHVVCIPLAKGKVCLGVLVAAVPIRLLEHIQNQTPLLQAFGHKAGTALLLRRQSDHDQQSRLADAAKEQQLSVKKLAHEVNNPLSVIKNVLNVIDDKITRQEPVRNELSQLSQEITRVGSIVDDFSDASPGVPFGPVVLAHLIPDLVQLLQESRFFPASVQVSCNLSAQIQPVHGSPDLIKQILLNLIKNARECLPDGGQISIHDGQSVTHAGQAHTRLLITDNGPGLSPALQAALFEPVQSSKAGGHRGLGLSIVNDLVKKMAGHISYSTSSAGTQFEILLPQSASGPDGR